MRPFAADAILVLRAHAPTNARPIQKSIAKITHMRTVWMQHTLQKAFFSTYRRAVVCLGGASEF